MDRCLISRVGALGDEIVRNTESQEGKMKKTDWHDQPRQSRLASVMYPQADRGKPSPFAKRKI